MSALLKSPLRSALAAASLAVALVAAGGCASSQLSAQWSDPQFAGQPPRGARVLVACQAPDATLRRICVDQLAGRLAALGAQPVPAADPGDGPAPDETALLQAARAAGAAALLRGVVSAEAALVPAPPSIGISIGGFGGGYRGGGGVGIGVAAPLGGGGPAEVGYAASAALTDVASGRLMWSGRASAAPSRDAGAQMATLAGLLLDAARQSGLFGA